MYIYTYICIPLISFIINFLKFSGKGSGDKQQKDKVSKSEDSNLSEQVKQLMDMTQKSEDEVILILHQCDYNMNDAADLLLENSTTVRV